MPLLHSLFNSLKDCQFSAIRILLNINVWYKYTFTFNLELIIVLICVTSFQRLTRLTCEIIFDKCRFILGNVICLLFLEAETISCPHEGCNFFTKFKHILKNHISGKHTNTVSKSNYLFMHVTKILTVHNPITISV